MLHADLFILSYEQIGAKWTDPFIRECRGECQAADLQITAAEQGLHVPTCAQRRHHYTEEHEQNRLLPFQQVLQRW